MIGGSRVCPTAYCQSHEWSWRRDTKVMKLGRRPMVFLLHYFSIFKIIIQLCHLLPPLSFLQPCTPHPWSLSNSWPLLSLIIVMYIYAYICTYISKYLNITCLECIMLLIYMFSGLIIWYWITEWYTLPWGKQFSHSQHSKLLVYPSLCRLRPAHFGKTIAVVLVHRIFR